MKMLKKYINHFILIQIALTLLAVQSTRAADPAYNGKALSDWLVLNLTGDASAQDAIRQIGTNGIPTLIDILGAKEGNRRKVLRELKSEELKQEFSSKDSNLADLRNLAVQGFAVLGTNAESAVPQLAKLFRDSDTCFEAARALSQVGPKGISALTNAMNDEDLAGVVVSAFGQHNSGDPKVITEVLICALKNPDPVTRGNAARFLRGKDAALAIPALLPMLDETNDYPLRGAIIALGSYGPTAKVAAPKLFSIYTNAMFGTDLKSAHDLGVGLMEALRNIDRDTAAKTEAFIINGGPLGVAGYGWTVTKLPNGKELIAGGSFHTTIPTEANHDFAHAQLFDPATGKRTEINSMNVARCGHTATLLRNGKVLVAGGKNLGLDGKDHNLSSAELYDPMPEKWTETGSVNAAHFGDHAALQPNGKVLIYSGGFNDIHGGWWDGVSKGWTRWVFNQELYDPATGQWTVITNR